MINHYKIIYRTGEEDWETKEIIITADQHRIIQQALIRGEDYIVIKDKVTIKRTSIVSISDADDIVIKYQEQGIGEYVGLPPAETKKLTGNVISGREKVGDYLKRTKESLYKRMNWGE